MTREETLAELKKHLVEMFAINESAIIPGAQLYQDLKIDSIDAVDLILRLEEVTGHKMEPNAFKSIRTVDDMVTVVHGMMQEAK